VIANFAQSVTYTDWDSVQSLLDDVTDLHIRQLSQLAWVYVGEYKHIISIARHGYLRVDRDKDGSPHLVKLITGTFYCTETRELPINYAWGTNKYNKNAPAYSPPRLIFSQSLSLAHAIASADTYAKSRFPHVLISRLAMWRNGAATAEQIKFVNKFKSEDQQYDSPGSRRRGRSLTKGAAGDFITRIRHGGKGIWEKTKARLEKAEKEAQRYERIKRAESVGVGAIA
jgi:ATP-dependent helicase IRC3